MGVMPAGSLRPPSGAAGHLPPQTGEGMSKAAVIRTVVLVALVILAWRYVRSRRPDDGSADGDGQDGGGHGSDHDGERARGAHPRTGNGAGLSGR